MPEATQLGRGRAGGLAAKPVPSPVSPTASHTHKTGAVAPRPDLSPRAQSKLALMHRITQPPIQAHIPLVLATPQAASAPWFMLFSVLGMSFSFSLTWSKAATQKPASCLPDHPLWGPWSSHLLFSIAAAPLCVCLPQTMSSLRFRTRGPLYPQCLAPFGPRAVQRQDLTCAKQHTAPTHTCEPLSQPHAHLLICYLPMNTEVASSADHSVPRTQANEEPQEENTQDLDKQGVPHRPPAAVLRVAPSLLCWLWQVE